MYHEYNCHTGGVYPLNQMISYYPFSHWNVKFFFHVIDTAIVNAYILYSKSRQSSRKLTHVNFRMELAKGLFQHAGEEIEALSADPATQSAVQGEAASPPLRLTGRHSPEKGPPIARGRHGQLKCVMCSKRKGGGKVITADRYKECVKALYVVPCLEQYHTCAEPTRHIQHVTM